MHPRIAERRNEVTRADLLSTARADFARYRSVLHEARAKVPGVGWDAHIQAIELLCAELNRIDLDDPLAFTRMQILFDALQALQRRARSDIALAAAALFGEQEEPFRP